MLVHYVENKIWIPIAVSFDPIPVKLEARNDTLGVDERAQSECHLLVGGAEFDYVGLRNGVLHVVEQLDWEELVFEFIVLKLESAVVTRQKQVK